MKEYVAENSGCLVPTNRIGLDEYIAIHSAFPIVCHDLYVTKKVPNTIEEGVLIVSRNQNPAKGELWCLGGRVTRGLSTEDSLRGKVFAEAKVIPQELDFIGASRHSWRTNAFENGRGTDTPCLTYTGFTADEITLDDDHTLPIIVSRAEYLATYRTNFHPCARDHLDMIFQVSDKIAPIPMLHYGVEFDDELTMRIEVDRKALQREIPVTQEEDIFQLASAHIPISYVDVLVHKGEKENRKFLVQEKNNGLCIPTILAQRGVLFDESAQLLLRCLEIDAGITYLNTGRLISQDLDPADQFHFMYETKVNARVKAPQGHRFMSQGELIAEFSDILHGLAVDAIRDIFYRDLGLLTQHN
jgi:hypothetical protein